jgi:hypothetical protein
MNLESLFWIRTVQVHNWETADAIAVREEAEGVALGSGLEFHCRDGSKTGDEAQDKRFVKHVE